MRLKSAARNGLSDLVAAASLALAAIASAPAAAAAPPADPPVVIAERPLDELERAFWVCDHTATTQGIEATPIALCSAVFDALRDEKFGGDFARLLAWWQQNKAIEHTRLTAP